MCVQMLLGVAVVAVLVASVQARDYFVAPDGDDANAGTLGKPLKDPVQAAARLMPGDTLYFRAGTYKCRKSSVVGLAPVRSGEPGKPISFKSYNNERVLIDCTGSDWGFTPDGHSYIVFDGFEIVNPTHYGMKISAGSGGRGCGSHITVRNCEVHDTGGECIFSHSTPHLLIENCHLHHSRRSHGLYLQVGCHNAVVRNVTSENNHGNSGMQLNAATGGIKNALVERCLLGNNAQGFSLMGVQNCTFRHNVVMNDGYEGPRGAGYREVILWTYKETRATEPPTLCENCLFENNTIVNLLLENHKLNHLVYIKSGSKGITFRNNIFYVRGKPVFTIEGDSREAHVFENNCVFSTAGIEVDAPDLGVTTLTEFAGKLGLRASGNIAEDPLFVDVEKGDVRLQSGSPCRVPGMGALAGTEGVRIGCELPWKGESQETTIP
jgi:hypothetical protein